MAEEVAVKLSNVILGFNSLFEAVTYKDADPSQKPKFKIRLFVKKDHPDLKKLINMQNNLLEINDASAIPEKDRAVRDCSKLFKEDNTQKLKFEDYEDFYLVSSNMPEWLAPKVSDYSGNVMFRTNYEELDCGMKVDCLISFYYYKGYGRKMAVSKFYFVQVSDKKIDPLFKRKENLDKEEKDVYFHNEFINRNKEFLSPIVRDKNTRNEAIPDI